MARDQLLDLALAPAARGLEQLTVILAREVRREDPYCRQVQGALAQPLEDDREPSDHAGRLHAVVGSVLRETETLRAISEERWIPGAQVEPSRIELRQVSHEVGGRLAREACQALDVGHELAIGKVGWTLILHDCIYHLAW